MDKILNLIEHTIALMDNEIQSPHPVAPPEQLLRIREEMLAIIHVLRSANLPQKAHRRSGIRRLIVDEWPMDSRLGNQILDALAAYNTQYGGSIAKSELITKKSPMTNGSPADQVYVAECSGDVN